MGLPGFARAQPTTWRRVALGLVLLVAFILRIWNLNWDEGTHQHPDERYWSIITSEISAAGPIEYFDSSDSTLNPYNLPGRDTWVYGTFPLYTTKATASFLADGPFPAGAIVTTANAFGIDLRTDGVDDFDAGYNANLIGRVLSALIDTGTVLLVYLLGRDLVSRRVGFVAAVLLAFTALHIQYAHFYGAEPWVTFFVTASIWMSLRLTRGDLRLRVAGVTGLLLGLAMASKLIAVAALVVPAVALAVALAPVAVDLLRTWWSRMRPTVRAAPVAVTMVLVSTAALLLSVAWWAPVLVIVTAVAAALAVTAFALGVVAPAERHKLPPALLFDQMADPPLRSIPRSKPQPAPHQLIWGAFVGLVVLAAAAVTYRIFQPYTFDGLFSIDERFTRDLDYLEGVNSGGNVPWVVQWIGRTPLLFPLQSAFRWGMGPALGLAVLVGVVLGARAVIRRGRWDFLPSLAFLTVMLGLVSQQFNPLIRYLLPAYPVAVVFAAFGIVATWDRGRAIAANVAKLRPLGLTMQAVAGAAIGLTVVWGLAFVNGVYNTDHPRITASEWMVENLPEGSAVSAQIWDDALPLPLPDTAGSTLRTISLDPFQADQAVDAGQVTKVDQFIGGLDEVDYVVEASNRVYDAVPRVPAKYPATTAYYDALFDGRLGFEEVARFRNAPSLFGFTFSDHDAEETFTVYDHPTVTIWAKTDAFSVERARALLNPAKASVAPDVVPSDAATNALLLRPDDRVATQTFNDTFSDDGIVAEFSWFFWLLWIQLAAAAVLPWTTLLFDRLPDKGYGLSKVLGITTVGLAVWLSVSWGIGPYGSQMIWVWSIATAVFGIGLWSRHRDRMRVLTERHRGSWMTSEAVFVTVFGLALLLRAANPDMWEAFLGGEKPMELAYLTAIGRSADFPAPDPWFAGGFMNYYYFGWYLLTVPMRALRIVPEVAFNLGVATYAAMTAVTGFSIVHNLVAISRTRWRNRPQMDEDQVPIRMGLLGVVLLLFIGNLDALRLHYDRLEAVNTWGGSDTPIVGPLVTFAGGTWAWVQGAELGRLDWWQPSRVNRGNFDITEFPYFTFLFGDLHPHMMGMVFVGLTVSLAMAYLLSTREHTSRTMLLAAALGVSTGLTRVVNTWDLPSVVIVTAAAIAIGQLIRPITTLDGDDRRRNGAILLGGCGVAAGLAHFGGPGSIVLLGLGGVGALALASLAASAAVRRKLLAITGHLALVAGTHVVVFWPFLRSNETFDTGLQSAVDESPLDDFLVHWGIFIGIAVALALALALDTYRRRQTQEPTPTPLPESVWASPAVRGAAFGAAALAVLVAGRAGTGALAISVAGVLVFGTFLVMEMRRRQPDHGRLLAVGLFTLAFAISGGVDVVTVQNDIERMNTVFKFWLQAWQYFAFAAAFGVWQVGHIIGERRLRVDRGAETPVYEIHRDRPHRSRVWMALVAITVLAGLAYPLLATRTRIDTRFASTPLTLDGLAYLDQEPTLLRNDTGTEFTISLADDLPLIEWLREHAAGSPTLVEWSGAGYDWNARMAIHTGLPTVLGWDWHQKQQRWDFQFMIDQRLDDVRRFYTEAEPDHVTRFLQAYEVEYVVVGTQEHRFATPESLAVLGSHPALEVAFADGINTIYRVDRNVLWPGVDVVGLELVASG